MNDKEIQAYTGVVSQMMHSPQTKESIHGMLKAGDPQQTIPQTAATLSNKAVEAYKNKRGSAPSIESIIAGSLVLGADLIEIGNVGGFFEVGDDQAMPIIEATNKAVLKDGMKNKYVDPVRLQELTNEGLEEGPTKAGLQAAEQRGMPTSNDQNIAMEQYAQQRESSALEQAMAQQQRQPQPVAQPGVQGGQNGI